MSQSLQLWRRNDAALDLRNYRHPDRADMGGGADVYERWGSGMTEHEREELIEKMVAALINSRLMGFNSENTARAALAVAEPVIREQCAALAERMGVVADGYNVADAIREGGE